MLHFDCRALILALALFVHPPTARAEDFYFGADLSYVNEMEDCGATYRVDGVQRDPYEIFHASGHNLVRLRLFHTPTWTSYSTLDDVRRSIRRARATGMEVLLDFHYSDDWADGEKQWIPAAWANIATTEELAQAVYDYTLQTLQTLNAEGLMPEMVQVGNETNREMLGRADWDWANRPIDWTRNAAILNAGIRGVREASRGASAQPLIMLHVAQPENVEPWFVAATQAGVTDYDLIGISYYRKWSTQGPDGLGQVINRVRHRYNKGVILVETSYPWTQDSADNAANLLGPDTLLEGYPATIEGQRRYMVDITQTVISNGGIGVVYWEPAWVSTRCSTRWGEGSHWENATYFDFHRNNELLPAALYARHQYEWLQPVTFRFEGVAGGVERLYLWGDFLGSRQFVASVPRGADGAFVYETRLRAGEEVRFQVYDRLPLGEGLIAPTEATTRAVVVRVSDGPTTLSFTLSN
ncbi:glycoside hydrolase family 53 protein [Terricaulis silvestris]|uniref:Arabinogalactan endo-beta-1,4-galactanase n=1 Tax=Terricaulis silvestris TaxID=2686094 RepID=A0A6I6MSA6_9CAUL|nr:arabinogalactan endo-1,4-beta-galactosidase [Terricaulis silvestris]QGZ96238.1 Arabinogalactan endo-1,4-beta-galactosidase precursor [Terricaulis silvestris]